MPNAWEADTSANYVDRRNMWLAEEKNVAYIECNVE